MAHLSFHKDINDPVFVGLWGIFSISPHTLDFISEIRSMNRKQAYNFRLIAIDLVKWIFNCGLVFFSVHDIV